MIDPLLLTCPQVHTFRGAQGLTNASGFFFARDGRLFFVTALHVLHDPANNHEPDRVELALHTSREDVAETVRFSVPLYANGKSLWRAATDDGGDVDVAVVEIDLKAMPPTVRYEAFDERRLIRAGERVSIGAPLLTVGYPMGFKDNLHKLPVARQATLASSFGLRFGGKGYFLVDSWTHRGISGAPVVMRVPDEATLLGRDPAAGGDGSLPWRLIGVHSARLEASTRDPKYDEVLGLNSVWYAGVLLTLTK